MTDLAIVRWTAVADSLKRPYRVTIPMVVLVLLVPVYLFLPDYAATFHAPELPVDRAIPLQPSWALVYGALYLFLILLPVFVVRQEALIGRTVYAYLTCWITAYVCFVAYPTVAPRPEVVIGDGFGASGLRFLYGADPPYNCFPSLHVAHSFVSALACHRVHRRVGVMALLCASLVAVSTLFTKQHYVLDVLAGALLALVAYVLFLRKTIEIPELDRRLAPAFAFCGLCLIGVMVIGLYVMYRFI